MSILSGPLHNWKQTISYRKFKYELYRIGNEVEAVARRKLRYELIDNRTGKTIKAFTNKTEGLRESCQYLRDFPADTSYVRFVVFEANSVEESHKVILNLGGDELITVCEDEGIKPREDLGYAG